MSIMNIISDFEKEKCPCGKTHTASVEKIIIENGAIGHLPKCINEYNGKKAFILADINTYNAAGEKVCRILDEGGIQYSKIHFRRSVFKCR
jgi:glycerol-1-phosphate dehydrogenase [NAD(P)+]